MEASAEAMVARLEDSLASMRNRRDILQSVCERQGAAVDAEDPEPEREEPGALDLAPRAHLEGMDPLELSRRWQGYRDGVEGQLQDAMESRAAIGRRLEELEAELRRSDAMAADLQRTMESINGEITSWCSPETEDEMCGFDLPMATPQPVPPADVISEHVCCHLRAPELSKLACVSRQLRACADSIFESRVLHMLASDVYGAPLPARSSTAPPSVCAAFLSGTFATPDSAGSIGPRISRQAYRFLSTVWCAPSLHVDGYGLEAAASEPGHVQLQHPVLQELAQQTFDFHVLRESERESPQALAARLCRGETAQKLSRRIFGSTESIGMHVDTELLMRLIEREALQILSVISAQESDEADKTDPRCGPSRITTGTLQLLQDVYDLWATADQQIDSAASKSTLEAVSSNAECAAAVRAVRNRQDEQQQTTSGVQDCIAVVLQQPALASRWPRAQESWSVERLVALKTLGNERFRDKQYDKALDLYQDALRLCDMDLAGVMADVEIVDEIERDCLLNSAACCLSSGEPEAARGCCDAALAIDPLSYKGWWRRGQSWVGLGRNRKAQGDLSKALSLAPRKCRRPIHVALAKLQEGGDL